MALIDINMHPSPKELRRFGGLFALFFGVVGGVVFGVLGDRDIAMGIWGAAGALTVLFFALRPLRLPLYLGWNYLVFPIGWTVSLALLFVVYYLVFTPFGLVMRLFGRDGLHRGFDKAAESYFVDRKPPETARYFRQF